MSDQSYILFNAGGIALATDAASVHCIHDGLIIQSEDDTVDWFLGMAVADERLLPVTDLGVFLNGSTATGRIIEVSRRFGIAGLKIDKVHGVSKQRPQRVDAHQTVVEVSSSLKNEAVDDLGKLYQLIDFASLLQSSRFLHIQHEPA